MKRILILIMLMSIAGCMAMAQSTLPDTKIPISTEPLDFKIAEFTVPDYCRNIFFDTDCKNIGFESFDKNPEENKKLRLVVTVKRVSDKQQLYQKEFKYETGFMLSANSIAEYDQKSVSVFNLESGTKLLKKYGIILGLVHDNIILSTLTGKVGAYSVNTGEEIWKKKLIGTSGLTYNQTIDKETDYIVTNDLVRINWNTGDTQKLESKTSITDKKEVMNKLFTGLALGAVSGIAGGMTGYYPVIIPTYSNYRLMPFTGRRFFFCPNNDKIAGLTSDIVNRDNLNYYADRNSIRCFDNNLNEKWKTELSEKGTRSNLFLRGDTVFMVNLATAFYGNAGFKQIDKPYIAAYRTSDGAQLFIHHIDIEDKSISSATIIDDKLHLLLGDHEAVYDFAANRMDVAPIDITAAGTCVSYIHEHRYYSKNDDDTFSAIKSTDNATLAVTSEGSIVDINSAQPKVVYAPDAYYKTVAYYGDMLFLMKNRKEAKSTELWCIKDGKATLVSSKVKAVGKKSSHLLIRDDDNKLQILDLDL